MSFQRIDQTRATELMALERTRILDIRDPASYQAGHIPGAVHIDNQTIGEFLASADKEAAVIVCCYHGNSSQGAADFLSNQGFSQSFSLDGGFTAWRLAGLAEDRL